MRLDESRHAQFVGEGVELVELFDLECGDDEEDEVGTVGAGFMELVFLDHEVLAQDGDVDCSAERSRGPLGCLRSAALR